MDDLERLTAELEDLARRLRDGELEPERAAALVQRCAELAASAGAELERRAREAAPVPGQTALL